MISVGLTQYGKVIERLKSENIDVEGKDVLIINYDAKLNGDTISGYTISKDKKWLCCPIHDEQAEAFIGECCWNPQCFEIVGEYETFLPSGDYSVNSKIFLLQRQED